MTIGLTDQQHRSLKALAAMQGKEIKQYALERRLSGDTDADRAWREMKVLLDQRIHDGMAGRVSAKSAGDIIDEELAEGSRG